MTRTIQLLRYMVGKDRVSVLGVAAALKWTETQVRNASQSVLKKKFIEVVECQGKGCHAFYRITESGIERSRHAPKTRLQMQREVRARRAERERLAQRMDESRADRMARKAQELVDERRQRAVLAAIEREEERARIARLAEETVYMARQQRHALDMAWGATA